ncbi:lasso RiPP family leader peptide-containing protein [Novipirellula sp.]|uniref:lasso RiPP family leader peptide-containing protein n=1 Tax=Novipirellula sp. TaxID=2795430 RepID=UPI00356AABC7
MKDLSKPQDSQVSDTVSDNANAALVKRPFEKPKLTFTPPKLVKHGEVTELTGFFGAFSP